MITNIISISLLVVQEKGSDEEEDILKKVEEDSKVISLPKSLNSFHLCLKRYFDIETCRVGSSRGIRKTRMGNKDEGERRGKKEATS